MLLAWHFTGDTLRDGRPIPSIGEWLEHNGQVILYRRGLHASTTMLGAFWHAPGLRLHRVEIDQVVDHIRDIYVARRRRILESFLVPERAVLRLAVEAACLAAWCARDNVPSLRSALAALDSDDVHLAYKWIRCADSRFRFTSHLNHCSAQLARVTAEVMATFDAPSSCPIYSDAHRRYEHVSYHASHVITLAAIAAGTSAECMTPSYEERLDARWNAYDSVIDCMEQRAITLFTQSHHD
jgi:hypothetical protein